MQEIAVQDFRQVGELSPALVTFGPDSDRFLTQDAAGLRINLPARRPNLGAVGIQSFAKVSGDFEIRVSYELLNVEQPFDGYGSGLHMHLVLDTAKPYEGVTLARCLRVEKGSVYMTNHLWQNEDRRFENSISTFPTEAKAGRLILRRAGSVLRFLVAEDFRSEPKPIDEREVGQADLRQVRFAANTGGGKIGTALDLRLLEVHISSGPPAAEPANPTSATNPSPKRGSRVWLVLGGMIGFTLLALLGIVVYLSQRKASARPAPPTQSAVAQQPRAPKGKV
jgi:hypothetical protein